MVMPFIAEKVQQIDQLNLPADIEVLGGLIEQQQTGLLRQTRGRSSPAGARLR